MTDRNLHETKAIGPDSPAGRRNEGRGSATSEPTNRPYSDAGNLYEIPRIRPEDPPMRKWWTDDEPRPEDGAENS